MHDYMQIGDVLAAAIHRSTGISNPRREPKPSDWIQIQDVTIYKLLHKYLGTYYIDACQ